MSAESEVEGMELSSLLVIEDDDGFRTEWPWPPDSTILHGASFVDACCRRHDEMRSSEVPE